MSAAVHRSTPALSVPPTQNTAPVLEFNCLYTHDLRRKQKRWQDGFLRYHTFNKRIMVYDVPRNFVGDMHWKEDQPLQEGDEVTLDKGGALVQVADSIGTTETDLSELLASAKKAPNNNNGSSPMRSMPPPNRRPTGLPGSRQSQAKHTSLNALLGTPRGPLGKATLPAKSPFEQRHTGLENTEWNSGRPPKRQRTDQTNAHIPRTTTKPGTPAELPLWARTNDATKSKTSDLPTKPRNTPTIVIDLRDEDPTEEQFLAGFSSDALERPSSPRQHETPVRKPAAAKSSSPGFETMRRPGKEPNARMRTNTERDSETNVSDRRIQLNPLEVSPESHETNQPEIVRPLRFATSAPKKKTLLCQGQMMSSSKRPTIDSNPPKAMTAIEPNNTDHRTKSAREKLEERLTRINSKNRQANPELFDKSGSPDFQDAGLQDAINILAHRPDRISPTARETEPPNRARRIQQQKVLNADSQRQNAATSVDSAPLPRTSRALKPSLSTSAITPARRSAATIQPAPQEHAPPIPALAPDSAAAKDPVDRPEQSKRPAFASRNKKPFKRAVSLNTASNGTSTVILAKPFQVQGRAESGPRSRETTPVPTIPPLPPNPWSREAFDLFDWRPPGWDEENWCMKETTD